MIRLATLALALGATPATAEFLIEEGTYFVMYRDYDHVTNSFTDGAPEGEGDGCFQITRVDLPGKTIDFTLVSGTITPWWSDGETFHPGFQNAFVPAIGFMETTPTPSGPTFCTKSSKPSPTAPRPHRDTATQKA